MWYILTLVDNILKVKNLSSETSVYVSVFISEDCKENYKEVIKPTLVDFEETFKLPFIDGKYKIKINRVAENTIIDTVEYIYPYYGLLLKSIINDLEKLLCDCKCKNCDDCSKDEQSILKVFLKSFSYYTLMYKYYPRFYDAIFNCIDCNILETTNCIIINEKVLGNFNNETLLYKTLSAFYYSFYYAEYYNANTEEDKLLINNKFKINRISKCKDLDNTNIDCLAKQIENNMGIFSIQFDRYNQPPSQVGDYNAGTVPNQASFTITPAMLTSLTTPAYADPEGDAPQAVRIDTLPTNGAILTYNNNPVTVGQIITIADMAANMLKIAGPNQSALVASSFRFSIRDIGSMQFTS